MARRKLREQKSKFHGTKNILQEINVPAHAVLHQLDPTAPSIPRGGQQYYVLAKSSSDDFDVEWVNVSSIIFTIDGGNASATAGSASYDGGAAAASHTAPALDGNSANASHSDTEDGGNA